MEPQDLARRAAELLDTAAAGDWRGSDPYDGLWWGWPAFLRGGRRRRQAIAQLHARMPFDFRRIYRAERPTIPKALGVFGSVGVRLRRLTGEERFGRLALDALSRLDADRTAGPEAWGYHWDVQTRWSFYPGGSPNVVVTAFAARGLADGADELGEGRFGSRARDAARWTLDTLYLPERGFFAYHPGSETLIHNASLLGARMVHALLPPGSAKDEVRTAVERTLAAQSADGSWPYGDGMAFVDSFHTGYVLDCLCALRDVDPAVDDAVRRGAAYYSERFFGADGSASLWPSRRYPLDGHSAGTGLTSLATLVRHGFADRDLVARVAERTADDMVSGGHAVFRRYRRGRSTVRYVRWCDAHVALGLADAAAVLAGER
ncbi:MAG: hypothetical protein ACJ768_25215 [Gaiellaceae bacterium]